MHLFRSARLWTFIRLYYEYNLFKHENFPDCFMLNDVLIAFSDLRPPILHRCEVLQSSVSSPNTVGILFFAYSFIQVSKNGICCCFCWKIPGSRYKISKYIYQIWRRKVFICAKKPNLIEIAKKWVRDRRKTFKMLQMVLLEINC